MERAPRMGGKRPRKKVCMFCVDRVDVIDYKDIAKLRKCMTERAKILPRRVTGTCAYHQRKLTIEKDVSSEEEASFLLYFSK